MSVRNELLLEFVRSMARHSGLRHDRVAALLAATAACLEAGTNTAQVAAAATPPTGDDVLVAHEIGLLAAIDESGLPPIDADDLSGLLDDLASTGAVHDDRGAIWVCVHGLAGPLLALRLDPPAEGWDADGSDLTFAASVVEELAATLLRHWTEQQHLDRADALLEAQRHTHVGCFEWDIVADKVRWSDELFRIYGNEPQAFEPTFEEFLERIHEDDREAVRASVYQAYEEKRDYRIEERIIRPDGSIRQLASWGHVIVDEDTKPIKILGSCQDVTDFRAAMEELSETARRLTEVQERRVQALELNDNVVQGLATALYALELGDADKVSKALSGTLQSARSIIDDLLTTSGEDLHEVGLARSEPAPSFLMADTSAVNPHPSGNDVIRVVVADDASDIRLLASMILAAEPDFQVVAEAANGLEAVAEVHAHQPEMVLLDLAMPMLDGLATIPQILGGAPDTTIVVLSGFSANSASAEAITRGAHAYLEKGLLNKTLPDALRDIRRRALDDADVRTDA